MNPTVWTYLAYLIVSIALTVWVARTLFKNGAYFLEDALGNKELAASVNHLLVVGFYLINFGYITLNLKVGYDVLDARVGIETLAKQVGWVLLVLGGMHFFNLYLFNRMRRNKALQTMPPPVRPGAFLKGIGGAGGVGGAEGDCCGGLGGAAAHA
jgi:hypothetical protein